MKYERGSFITVPSREKLRGLEPTAQALYMWLCSYANETGNCYPSRAKLAEDCGCSERMVDSMVLSLEKNGLIEKRGRKQGEKQLSNLYTVLVHTPAGGATPPSTECPTPLQEVRTNSIQLTKTTEGGGDFAPLPIQVIEEIREEQEDPFSHWERSQARVIPKPYSPMLTKEAWKTGERRLQILEWFFTEKSIWAKAPTEVKLRAFMKRHSEAAKRLAKQDWKKSELNAAKDKALFNPQMEEEWTLETIEKYLTK